MGRGRIWDRKFPWHRPGSGPVKTESGDSVISSQRSEMWFYTVGKLGLNWGGAGSESRPPILGLPRRPASPTAAKLTSGRDPGSTARTGRQARQQHGRHVLEAQ